MRFVNLEWSPKPDNSIFASGGYRPETVNPAWKSFTPSDNGYVIAHDLMHHQDMEEGKAWQEVRAWGALWYFERCMTPSYVFVSENCHKIEFDEVYKIKWQAQSFFVDEVKTWFETLEGIRDLPFIKQNLGIILCLINEGYNYALTQDMMVKREIGENTTFAYKKIKTFNFVEQWNLKQKYLQVDRWTGNVIPIGHISKNTEIINNTPKFIKF